MSFICMACGCQKRSLDSLEAESRMVVNHHVRSGPGPLRKPQCFKVLSHLSSPSSHLPKAKASDTTYEDKT